MNNKYVGTLLYLLINALTNKCIYEFHIKQWTLRVFA